MAKLDKVKIDRLSDTSKKIISNYMVRKSVTQKTQFISFLKQELADTDMPFSVEKYNNSDSNRNIIVGNINKAKYVYTAHYDTCATMFFLPNFITPRNIFVYILYQLILTAVIFAISFGVAIGVYCLVELVNPDGAFFISYLAFIGSLLLILFQMMVGIPNKNNYNDNTSGVITLVEMIKSLPEELKTQVCFIFFDNEEKGLLGSTAFAKWHKKDMENKILVNFDCVSDGDNLLLVHKKINEDILNEINNSFEYEDKNLLLTKSSKALYPSDQAKFKCPTIAVAALKKSKLVGYYMNRIHTNRDVVFDQRNIEVLKDIFINISSK